MAGRLNGRCGIVTGAGSGIGAATARRLREDGALVLTADLKGDVDLLLDVAAKDAGRTLTEAALARFDRLDFVVPCAGVSAFCPLEGHSDDYFEQVMAVNVTAVFRLIRDAAPHLRASPAGRIVTIGSVTSAFGDAGLVAYGTSKHAVLGMTRALAGELGADGVTANCVMPGAIDTPMTAPAFAAMPEYRTHWEQKSALGRLGQPEDIADVIAFLLSDDARFVTGQGWMVDGGAMTRM
ncbi:SDR family NAD(P)-dependent oxidoreductase [Novosphingobium humi]|uniref:SDR family NAD(P)-dependent oxidoreductase n=1 Tax=Novosphingobium humi TaxID=2282397 RepID=A0ABY7U401_9SPHN|nr:SDR family NAD(P)-dependent oxidoreductase [Novosphingobium humi]WCT80207.1 SDR family NAD(P)-dependent oxidoreductase [Novosphingobium humi]